MSAFADLCVARDATLAGRDDLRCIILDEHVEFGVRTFTYSDTRRLFDVGAAAPHRRTDYDDLRPYFTAHALNELGPKRQLRLMEQRANRTRKARVFFGQVGRKAT